MISRSFTPQWHTLLLRFRLHVSLSSNWISELSSGFGTDTKDRIKQANDIVDLVGSYTQLRRSGSRYVCRCPFHEDTRPSLQINPARQSWACYVCNIRGDVFDFVMRKEGVEFFEAMKILAERAGIPINVSEKKAVKGSPQDKQTLYKAVKWAVERFHTYLLESPDAEPARNYLAERTLNTDIIDQFRLGFAPLKYTWLADQARSTEFSPAVLAACDLIAKSDRGSGYFERFRGRLIFPIFDVMGRPIAIGGRQTPGVKLESQAKYVNSRETRLFSKSDTLYGLNFVKDTVSKTRQLTIVEGYTDVIGCWKHGVTDVVACLGTALNEKHISLIKRFADRINLVLDGDEAGRKRANEVLDLFVANDVDLRILTLPDGMDPFEFVEQNGREAFGQLVADSADAIEHKNRIETEGIDLIRDTHLANVALERVLQTISRIPATVFTKSADKLLRQDQLLTRLARRFGVDRDQLKRRLVELRTKAPLPRQFDTPDQPQPTIDMSSLLRRETELMELLLNSPEHLDTIIENVPPELFVEGPLKQLFLFIDQCFQNGDSTNFDDLMLTIENPDLKNVLCYLDEQWHEKMTLNQESTNQDNGRIVNETIEVFRNLEFDSGNRKAISELSQQELNEQEELSTLEELLNQTRQRHGL